MAFTRQHLWDGEGLFKSCLGDRKEPEGRGHEIPGHPGFWLDSTKRVSNRSMEPLPGRFLGPGARQRGGSCPGSDLALHSPRTLMLVEAIRTQIHTHARARILNVAFGSISSIAEPGFATILPSLATTLGPNSHRDRRCLQESWGQITSMYFNTRKQYKWLRFSEDCLYLNVYAPVRARGDAPLPVSIHPLPRTIPLRHPTAQLRPPLSMSR